MPEQDRFYQMRVSYDEDIKSVIVTGAAGFTGYSLVKALSDSGITVYAIVRPGSKHNRRLDGLLNVIILELDFGDIDSFDIELDDKPYALIHLAWDGKRYSCDDQVRNIWTTLHFVDMAYKLGCKRFVCTGSQAEYGATTMQQTEDMTPDPFCAYGAAKVAACYMSRYRAMELGIDWIWGRIFSLYGIYEPCGRLLPDMVSEMIDNEDITLSSCRQNWDYLYVSDAAEAIIALVKYGRNGEIYNIANGDYRPLREYVEEARMILGSESRLSYGNDPDPYVSLQPSVQKIYKDTGWKARTSFCEGIMKVRNEENS